MNKRLTLLSLINFVVIAGFAANSCTIDSANTQFFAPGPDSLPCIERTVYYDQSIQIAVPTTINLQDFGAPLSFILTVDSVVITGVNGLPNGITYAPNPSNGVLYGGKKGCAQVYGTTTDSAGHYPITFNGTFTAHGFPFPPFFDGDTTIDFATLQSLGQGMFDMFVDVINPGDPCRPSLGIGSFNSSLNTNIHIVPNPSNGIIGLSLDAGRRLNGEIAVLDMTGRKIFSQPIDAVGLYKTTINLSNYSKGLYTLQLRTAEGFESKSISIE